MKIIPETEYGKESISVPQCMRQDDIERGVQVLEHLIAEQQGNIQRVLEVGPIPTIFMDGFDGPIFGRDLNTRFFTLEQQGAAPIKLLAERNRDLVCAALGKEGRTMRKEDHNFLLGAGVKFAPGVFAEEGLLKPSEEEVLGNLFDGERPQCIYAQHVVEPTYRGKDVAADIFEGSAKLLAENGFLVLQNRKGFSYSYDGKLPHSEKMKLFARYEFPGSVGIDVFQKT